MSDSTLGIIGSGQLGSMLCQAAKKLNVRTVVISDDEQGPAQKYACLLYTSPSPRDRSLSRMPSSA